MQTRGRCACRLCGSHEIEVDEVCDYKPPALVYVDDRAIPFRGNWDQTIEEIRQFRK